MSAWANVAKLVKLKNLDGGLVVKSTTGLPLFIQTGMDVFFVPPALEGPRRARVKEMRVHDPLSGVVFFDGIDSAERAQNLVGQYCLIDTEQYPEYRTKTDENAHLNLEGYAVQDKIAGTIGTVKVLHEDRPQALLVVEGQTGEVLVPYVDEIIVSIDHEAKLIHTLLPAGLLGL